jgi:hypothetical protein
MKPSTSFLIHPLVDIGLAFSVACLSYMVYERERQRVTGKSLFELLQHRYGTSKSKRSD